VRLLIINSIVFGLIAGGVCPAWAQAPAGQPRATAPEQPRVTGGLFGGLRPVDPNQPDRPSQQVTLNLDVAGGYDQNVGVDDEPFVGPEAPQSGAIGASAVEFLYRWGTSRNYLDASAHANTTFARVGVQQRGAGDSQIQAAATMGRRAGLSGAVAAAYEPTYLFNAFGGLATEVIDGVVPGATLTEGFTEQRWLSTRASGNVYRNWTTRQKTDFDYAESEREPITGDGLGSHSRSADIRHDWSFRQHAGLQFNYQFYENRQVGDTEDPLPLRSHQAGLSMRLERRVGPHRAVAFDFGGGVTQSRTRETAESGPVEFVVPSGSAGVLLTLSSRWSVSFDASRDVTVLEGLSPQPFNTDALSLVTEGKIGRQIVIRATVAHARGAQSTGDTGAFDTTTALAELRYLLSRCCALTTSYSYYDHQLFDLQTVEAGFPSSYRRNSIRFGISFWMPLFGTFQEN
jgi:hypothetical protein